MTSARVVDRATARTSGTMSSTVTGTVVSYPRTLLPAESPTSSAGTPTSSKSAAVSMSYDVSIAHFSPRSLADCRSRTVMRRLTIPPYRLDSVMLGSRLGAPDGVPRRHDGDTNRAARRCASRHAVLAATQYSPRPSWEAGEPQDPVVGRRGGAAPVAVRCRDPDRPALRVLHRRAQPAVRPVEHRRRRRDCRAGEAQSPDPRAPQRRDVEAVAADADTRGRGLAGRPRPRRVAEAAVVAGALDRGPAVVAAGHDQGDLLEVVLPELRCPQVVRAVEDQALHVAVPERPDPRPARRVAGRGSAGRRDPQDLSAEAGGVLRVGGVPRVAGAGVEESIRTEHQPSAVVVAAGWDAGDDRRRARGG